EFGTVVLPLFNQHFPMLFRSLVYTSLTRARQLALSPQNTANRQTARQFLLTHDGTGMV
ncbi:MAG: hypothetical protein H7Z75_12330, partial [Ferruginibacter sp.]|nr:hypothetical protein [Cytophagales bacterium]